jgi:integrase
MRNLRNLFNYAVREDYMAKNPIGRGRAEMVPVPKRERVIPTEGEMKRILEASRPNPALHEAILILGATGLRVGEYTSLEPNDWCAEKRELTVRCEVSKTGVERKVPVRPEIAAIIEKHLEESCRTRLFMSLKNMPWKTFHLSHMMHRLGVSLKLPYSLHPHLLRSYCCSNLLAHGVPLPTVQKVLGHASAQTTLAHYAVAMRDKVQGFIDAVPLPS